MSSPLQDLLGQLSGDQVARLSATLGSDRAATQRAVNTAIPMMFSALAANARRPEGAQALAGAALPGRLGSLASMFDADGDGSVLDDAARIGAGMLGGLVKGR